MPALYCSAFTPVDSNLRPIVCNEQRKKKPLSLGNALLENIAPGCTYIFNRKALEEFRKYRMGYITIHDWDLYRIVMALNGNVIYDDEPHILYRQHGSNTIGFQARGLHHWSVRVKRFLSGKNRNTRYYAACHIKECFYSEMPEQNQKIISLLTEYQESLVKKLRLVASSEFAMSHRVDTYVVSMLALLKRI